MRVDFYIIQERAVDARLGFTCRLIEKAYKRNHRIFVQCLDREMTEALDDLLWCYKDESFIPHNIQGEGPNSPPPVQLGHDKVPTGFNDILINLSNEVPTFFRQFKRIIEVVCDDETIKAQTRNHFKHYRSAKLLIKTHHITTSLT